MLEVGRHFNHMYGSLPLVDLLPDCRGGVEKGVLLVIEGYTDNISCQQIGFKNFGQ
jgi:hypothetical protein